MTGLVLAGGGARGAYEAGVLRFIFESLPARTGTSVRPQVVCGTSAGALNGAAAVAAAGDAAWAARLSHMWRDMSLDKVFRLTACDLARAPALTLGARLGGEPSLLDASPFTSLVRQWLPWRLIRQTLDSQVVSAFAVATTDVDNGRSVLFVDRPSQAPAAFSAHPETVVVPTRIGAEHCLASAAMPFLFPPVHVDGRLLVDGGLRLNTPLSPALHLGADRLLVVGTHSSPRGTPVHVHANELSLGFLMGKAMTALMLDPIEQDLRRLALVNDVLQAGEDAYGPDFAERLAGAAASRHKAAFRRVDSVLLHPSEDLGAMAAAAWRSGKVVTSAASHLLLSSIAATERAGEADLLSFLLFDRSFTAGVEELGHRDAAAKEGEILRLFGDGGVSPPLQSCN